MIAINHLHGVKPTGNGSLGLGMPETGSEFDFMNYLLGLQVSSEEPVLGIDELGNAPLGKGAVPEGESELGLLFGKKEDPSRNPLLVSQFSPLPGQTDNTGPSPMAIAESDGKSPGMVKAVFKNENYTKSALESSASTSKQIVGSDMSEDPLAQLTFHSALQSPLSSGEQQASRLSASVGTKDKAMQAYKMNQKVELIPTQEGVTKPFVHEHLTDKESVTNAVASSQSRSEVTQEAEGASVDRKTFRKESDPQLMEVMTSDSAKPLVVTNGTGKLDEMSSSSGRHSVPELFQKVDSMIHQGGGRMTITLSPAELGQVEIEVSTKGKNVEINVKSENDFAKSAIEGHVADLKHSLQLQDLNLSKMEVQVNRELDHSFLDNRMGFSGQESLYQHQQSYRQGSQNQLEGNQGADISFSQRTKVTGVSHPAQAVRATQVGSGRLNIQI